MQLPPLLFSDLTLLFAVASIILLITTELSSSYYGQLNLIVNRKKLKICAYISSGVFLITAIVRTIILIL